MSPIARSARVRRTRSVCALALAGALIAADAAHAAALIYGYAFSSDHLVSFYSDAPFDLVGDVALTGLGASEFLTGLDFRPATGELYSVAIESSTARVVTIDTTSGAVTTIGTPQPAPFGTPGGLDFDPVLDRLHYGGDTNELYEIDPDTGVMVLADGLHYATADLPHLAHIAFTNSMAGATTTTLYGIDPELDELVVAETALQQGDLLTTVGFLGHGMHSRRLRHRAGHERGLCGAPEGSDFSSLYGIDLATGHATEIGAIGGGRLAGIAIAPEPVPEPGTLAGALCAITAVGLLRRRTLR